MRDESDDYCNKEQPIGIDDCLKVHQILGDA